MIIKPVLLKFIYICSIFLFISAITYGARWYQDQQEFLSLKSDTTTDTLESYAQKQLALQKESKNEKAVVTFLAVGDISLSRGIALAIHTQKDPRAPFAHTTDLLQETDFNFGNLETPFSDTDTYTAKETLIFNAPKPNIAGLKTYNFKVLSLANNHALDQGLKGLTITRDHLAQNGILFTGTGQNLDEAWVPAVYEQNGIKIGFLAASYASINDGGKTRNEYVARIEDTERLQAALALIKQQADFVVVSMHAGTEYTEKPNQGQISFAHAAVDAGADMVIGHHPHWVQEKELYCPNQPRTGMTKRDMPTQTERQIIPYADTTPSNCKPIYYSLGNFIFDQSWSQKTKQGLTLKITIEKEKMSTTHSLQPAGPKQATKLVRVEEIPIVIENNCCPKTLP